MKQPKREVNWHEKEKPESVTAWPFGDDPDHFARLVMDGIKTAPCSARPAYDNENDLFQRSMISASF